MHECGLYPYCITAFVDRYGGRHTVTMMPGEGIGPEMMGYVKDVYQEAGVPVDFEMIHLDPTTDNYDDLYNVSLRGPK